MTALARLRQRVVARLPVAELGLELDAAKNIFCMDYLPQAELMAHNKACLHGFLRFYAIFPKGGLSCVLFGKHATYPIFYRKHCICVFRA